MVINKFLYFIWFYFSCYDTCIYFKFYLLSMFSCFFRH